MKDYDDYFFKDYSSIKDLPPTDGVWTRTYDSSILRFVSLNDKAVYHNSLGPAMITMFSITYYIDGVKHRDGKPANITASGTKEWYVNGRRHRLDGPAYEDNFGTKWWFYDGLEHRLDGPAGENASGTKEWYVNGQRHRLDGPAIELGLLADNRIYEKIYFFEDIALNSLNDVHIALIEKTFGFDKATSKYALSILKELL